VVNTGVLFGRGARQIWILNMDGATPEQQAQWTGKKHLVHEEDIISRIPSVVIGADTILRDNPITFPVHDGQTGLTETLAALVTIAVPSSIETAKTTA